VNRVSVKLDLKVVRKHTHAGSAKSGGISLGLDTNTEDLDTGSVNIDLGAEVGEVGSLIGSGINSTDSDGVRGRARRSQGSLAL
jgi:hypothetical protein